MVFIVGHDGKLRRQQEAKAPEIYRMTPYEYAVTANPVQEILTCMQAIPVRSSIISTTLKSPIRALPSSVIAIEGFGE